MNSLAGCMSKFECLVSVTSLS